MVKGHRISFPPVARMRKKELFHFFHFACGSKKKKNTKQNPLSCLQIFKFFVYNHVF